MKALTYRLRLLEPVLVAQAESGEENSAIGLSFIHGSAIRGALVARYLQRNRVANLATDETSRRMFLDGTCCFLNAYPSHGDSRFLPKPMSWFTEKDRADDPNAELLDGAVTGIDSLKQPKPPSGDFCDLRGTSAALYSPARQINVHIALLNANQRGDENKVYRYDALAEGEIFDGVILGPTEHDLSKIQELMTPDQIQIGAAHTAGYGRVQIEEPDIPAYWEEYSPGNDPTQGQVVLTLLSDSLLRGDDGQVYGGLNAFLVSKLNKPGLVPEKTFRQLHRVGGFNRKWSLPLPQDWALGAGSVYIYSPNAGLDPVELRSFLATGIGERRAEGFGRVAVNWNTEPVITRYSGEVFFGSPPDLSEKSKQLAQKMATRRLHLFLERALLETVNTTALRNVPQNAQLSRIRNAIQRGLVQAPPSLKAVSDHLEQLKGAREQFVRARVNDTPMLDWIDERVKLHDVRIQLLRSAPLPKVAGERATLKEEMEIVYTARLVDGVMKKAIRQNQEDKQ